MGKEVIEGTEQGNEAYASVFTLVLLLVLWIFGNFVGEGTFKNTVLGIPCLTGKIPDTPGTVPVLC